MGSYRGSRPLFFIGMPHAHKNTTSYVRTPFGRNVLKRAQRRRAVQDTLRHAAKITLEGMLLAVMVTIAVQLAYPSSKALPQTSIGGLRTSTAYAPGSCI